MGWSTVHWASIRWAQTYASVPIVGQSKTNPRLVPKYLPGVMFEFLNRRTILKVPHWNLKHSSHRFGCPTACYKSGFSSNSVSTEAVWMEFETQSKVFTSVWNTILFFIRQQLTLSWLHKKFIWKGRCTFSAFWTHFSVDSPGKMPSLKSSVLCFCASNGSFSRDVIIF